VDTGPNSATEADTDLKTESESRIVSLYVFENVSTWEESYGIVDVEPCK